MLELSLLCDGVSLTKAAQTPLHQEGVITLKGLILETGTEIVFFEQGHDVKELLLWLNLVKSDLLKEQPPGVLDTSLTLAKSIAKFYDDAGDDIDQTLLSQMWEYRRRHDFRFAMRGTDIPSTLIGLWRGVHTISSAAGDDPGHAIDLDSFLRRR